MSWLATMAVVALACGCEPGAGIGDEKREIPPAALFVRAPSEIAEAVPASPPDGSEGRPYSTLAAALRAAPPGALLRIGEGEFRERLLIARPVVLLGRGAGRTRIMAPPGSGPLVAVRGADRVELHGLAIEGGSTALTLDGGAGHRLENVRLSHSSEAAIVARGSELFLRSVEISLIAAGGAGRAIDVEGGSVEARKLLLHAAGRRAIALKGARALLVDVDVEGSSLSALQATDGAEVEIVRGRYAGLGGAAIYVSASKLALRSARVERCEFGVLGFRGSSLAVADAEIEHYRVAGVAFVNSHGTVERCKVAHGGTDAGIAVTGNVGTVAILDNRIHDPGVFGVHLTDASAIARGNTITAARSDREGDLGDGLYAMSSELQLADNLMRNNAGSGVAVVRSTLKLTANRLVSNGRAGLLLLDGSSASAAENWFQSNRGAGVELAEASTASLLRNRFGAPGAYDIDAGCWPRSGSLEILEGNTFIGAPRQRACP